MNRTRHVLVKLGLMVVFCCGTFGCDPDAGACEELAADPGCIGEPLEGEECEVDGADECSACYRDKQEELPDDCSGAAELDAQCESACATYRDAK